MSHSLRNSALMMASSGIAIFPCGPNKKPLVAGGFHAATHDALRVAEWWTQWPTALIGRPTGAGTVVIDCDLDPAKSPPKDGESKLADLEASQGRLPPTFTVRTPRGGRHRYFRAPAGMRFPCSADKIAYGIDVRGDGGYVIAVPSPGYEVMDDAAQADLPPGWVELLRLPDAEKRDAIATGAHVDRDRVLDALRFIPATCSRDQWLHVGMALHDAGLSYEDFDQWSAGGGDKYQGPEDTLKAWQSFRSGGGRTVATVFALAKEHGYKPWDPAEGRRAIAATGKSSGPSPEPVEPKSVSPYSTRGWGELSRMMLAPQVFFWGDGFALGQLGTIFGQGGLGKSRISLNLCRNQVLGLPFADVSTGTQPLRHLLMGSENSIHRLQHDVRRMSAGLSSEQLAVLDDNIRMATLEHPDDPFITVASPENVLRWKATLAEHRPNVLWVDPWGDVLDGEANSDEDTRGTLQTLRRLLRQVDPTAALIVLAHSRTGARNLAQAVGFDAANFGKGSKALYSASRCVWNLAPADESEDPSVVCFMAKNNNGPRSEPFALRLDTETMLYTRDPNFDFEAWQDLVNQRAAGKRPSRGRPPIPLEQYRPHVLAAFQAGPMTSGRLLEHLRQATSLGEKRVQALLEECLHEKLIAKTPRLKERDGKVLYGTPEQVDAIMRPHLPLPKA